MVTPRYYADETLSSMVSMVGGGGGGVKASDMKDLAFGGIKGLLHCFFNMH